MRCAVGILCFLSVTTRRTSLLCFLLFCLIPRCVKFQESNDKSQLIFGSVTNIPAKDAAPVEVLLPVECPCHAAGASLIKHKELNVLLGCSRALTLCWFWKAVGIWCFIPEWFGWATPFPSLICVQCCKGSSEASVALMGQLNSFRGGYFQRRT